MKEINADKAKADMRKGMLEFCILLTISTGKVYATDILNKLKDANLLVVEGTLYPLLTRLRNQELLTYTWEESKSGPPRKYYTLTEGGLLHLENMKDAWKSLEQSIHTLLA